MPTQWTETRSVARGLGLVSVSQGRRTIETERSLLMSGGCSLDWVELMKCIGRRTLQPLMPS